MFEQLRIDLGQFGLGEKKQIGASNSAWSITNFVKAMEALTEPGLLE